MGIIVAILFIIVALVLAPGMCYYRVQASTLVERVLDDKHRRDTSVW